MEPVSFFPIFIPIFLPKKSEIISTPSLTNFGVSVVVFVETAFGLLRFFTNSSVALTDNFFDKICS